MHELSIARAVVGTAVRHAAGRRVTLVAVRVGSLRQVVPVSLAFYFEIAARETLCAGAELDYEIVAAQLRCPGCGNRWDPAPPPLASHEPVGAVPPLPTFRCPECGQPGEVEAGGELEVESIEVEDAAGTSL